MITTLPKAVALIIAVTLLVTLAVVHASSGDASTDFQQCLADCGERKTCELTVPLKLTGWTCMDDCKYTCMMRIETARDEAGARLQQYYGKWPFVRLLGMQEPASVLFSIANGWAHWRGLKMLRRIRAPLSMQVYAVSGINAWLWSAVFHTRDLPWTEKMDYFSAALTILCGLFAGVVRIFRLRSGAVCAVLAASLTYTFYRHVHYLTNRDRFDYTYNMAFNVAIGVAHSLLWLVWVARNWSRSRQLCRLCLGCVLALSAAMSLELFDFPPIAWTLDAHSLWHAVTVPIAMVWYRFLALDHRQHPKA
ncbi:hypothetical protein RI367_006053 [Sorochytrium milnesiophthora]